ncbi:MAG: SpoIIE family protein phosphatase [Desulfobacterales bacterium]|nr:MAG: SpoIIE family protein phosphatase [Desulfobacterales bacterium]
MKTISRKTQVRVLLLLGALIVSYAGDGLLPQVFETWNSRIIDQLFVLRPRLTSPRLRETSDVIHVDANFYVNRSHHAQVIRNLAAMDVGALLVDYVFPDRVGDEEDLPLINATAAAGNVYYGMAFETLKAKFEGSKEPLKAQDIQALDGAKWQVVVEDDPKGFRVGAHPLVNFAALSSIARGSGFLNLTPDPDGILRRVPLLVRYRGAFYPSLAFRAVCGYFGVVPHKIIVQPGRSITLKDAKRSDDPALKDIVLPIDKQGNLIINFTGSWRRIPHYSYSEILQAADRTQQRARLKNELAGKIAILSETVDEPFRIRPIGMDRRLSSGVIHAVIIQNILEGSFLSALSGVAMLLINIALLAAVFFLAVRFSSLTLSLGTLGLVGLYVFLGVFFFSYVQVVWTFVQPLFMLIGAWVAILIAVAIERALLLARTEKARRIAERELEIGRQIQAGFFPTHLPTPKGWELIAHFQPARHVAGDFYDAFTLEGEKKIAIVIADVCDKGVGAALFMALFRSLIRVLSVPVDMRNNPATCVLCPDPAETLQDTIRSVNDYISITHDQANMFATIFFGILEAETGLLFYINAGHEPPVVVGPEGIKTCLNPTGPAVGVYPARRFTVHRTQLAPEDLLVAFTDGVVDARNRAGKLFSRENLMNLLTGRYASAEDLTNRIQNQIKEHINGQELYDDITILALRRLK